MGGLIKGEFPEAFVLAMAERGKVAVDVQGFLRVSENGPMVFRDWDRKRDIISHIHYLKTDAAEAEILTGLSDVDEAARTLRRWGAAEVVLTHNRGVLVCADSGVHGFPWTSRNLSGRTGRGDTCFSSYCAWRKHHTPEESVRFAAALTSLKMEVPGPFGGTVADVEAALTERPGY
jgi:sugar/nucleoside kinase (ribokinase family)